VIGKVLWDSSDPDAAGLVLKIYDGDYEATPHDAEGVADLLDWHGYALDASSFADVAGLCAGRSLDQEARNAALLTRFIDVVSGNARRDAEALIEAGAEHVARATHGDGFIDALLTDLGYDVNLAREERLTDL
jgi:hypothetical protein